jgi:hypothetical protein
MTDRLPPKSEPRGCFRPPEPPRKLKSKMYIYEKDSEGRRVAKEVERFIGKKSDELRQKEADDFLKYLVKWSESADVGQPPKYAGLASRAMDGSNPRQPRGLRKTP